jgi:sterol desaturase/sphingolipid hydroxylase (fatty acid hydroxylase superfamily)
MNWVDFEVGKMVTAGRTLISPAAIFSLPQLAVALMLAFAFLVWRQSRRRGAVRLSAVLRAMRGRRIVFHRSTGADLFYAFVNTFAIAGLIGWGMISGFTISHAVTHGLRAAFGTTAPSTAPGWLLRSGATLLLFVAYELAYYVDHWLKHRVPFLWEFHKVHHTAEVLTPLTVYRVHPVDTLIFVDIIALFTGVANGALTWAAGRSVEVFQIDGSNALTVVGLFLLAQLQHSQFWIPFTGPVGRLLLSPAHHQIHHSTDPAHYNTNLGSFLAIWDWMFGTLVIPSKDPPRLKFGVIGLAGDPHRLSGLMIDPTVAAFRVLRLKPAAASAPDAPTVIPL